MTRKLSVLTLTCALSLMLVVPAQAAGPPPPEHETLPLVDLVEGHVPECDRTLRWDIEGDIRLSTFFDADGEIAKQIAVVTELNTITDVDNDVTLREGPVAFAQTTTFNADGTQTVEINGLSVHVHGGENKVVDVGRLELLIHPDPDQSEVLHQSGRHDIRGLDPFQLSADEVHLPGFCPAFVA